MKIIFLDIDGVLNSELSMRYYRTMYGGTVFNSSLRNNIPTIQNVRWGYESVAFLHKIIKETGAKIVLSSTWRTRFEIDKFYQMFALYGVSDIEIIGITPRLECRHRGTEIATWLEQQKFRSDKIIEIDNYVILDDDSDMLKEQMNNFVHTEFEFGLTEKDAENAIKILKNE